ncbi:hypothetical protein F2Q69_00006719 [Brassica cretica]|uniref:Uncharacterized protein n=1 Tax=Brassica cretica TaxID=69181 RepID=A0A8S9NXE6_BRACR|nr:hypothetical protein F2Q69_00006719 [Brassica cretica]
MWFPIHEAIVRALDRFELSISQLNVAALQNFLGVLIMSYELGMDLSPDDFEGLWGILQMPRDGSSVFSMFELMAHPSRRTVSPCSVENGTFIVQTVSSPRPPRTCLLSAIFSATVPVICWATHNTINMKESKVINRKRAKREQRGLISEFAFEREQQSFFDNPKRDETWVLRPRARGLCYGNLDEDARFRDKRSVLAHGQADLGAGSPRPWAR